MTASSIEQWRTEFTQDPYDALDRLLMGRVFMGALNRNETSEILFRLFHTESREAQQQLDAAMQSWLSANWLTVPSTMPVSRWAAILQDVFFTAHRLNLTAVRRWLVQKYPRSREWLRSLYLGAARAPEAFLLRTLALTQENQDLLPLWLRLCRLEEELPRHYAAIGLIGLRRLPDQNGKPPGDLSPLVFSGLVGLAEAIAAQTGSHEKNDAENFWLLECRAIMALYPRTDHYWASNFFPLIGSSADSASAKMLRKVIPDFARKTEKMERGKGIKEPSKMERERILALLDTHSVQQVRPELDAFLNQHRQYARQTGISELLVKTFSNIGGRIYRRQATETDFARQLLEETFLWEPYNPYVWTIRAKIEAQLGRRSRAEALLWEAKRRFPENAHVRTELANILIKQDNLKVAEMLYRQTIEDFPQDEVCRNGLADLLKAQGRLTEAEQVYRQTMKDCKKDCKKDVVCRNGLAEVLKMQGEIEEAEQLYRQTMTDFPKDVVCRAGLAEVLKAQDKLKDAEEVCQQAMIDFPSNAHCRTVLAGVLLQAGKREEAIALLEETKRTFPNNKIAAGFLEKVKSGPADEVPSLAIEPAVFSFVEEEDDDWPEESSGPLADVAPAIADIDSIDTQEAELGLLSLHRQAGEYEEARLILDSMLSKTPASISIPARLEQGFLQLAQDAAVAEEHFRSQLKLHPNAPSFKLGILRAQAAQGGSQDARQFQELAEQYPAKATLIRVEQFRLNGSVDAAEKLRKLVNGDISHIPAAERGKEQWLRDAVAQTLFTDVDINTPVSESILPKLAENCRLRTLRLCNATDQYLLAA
jgi:tetratricopeptide (TPR) repeat protein